MADENNPTDVCCFVFYSYVENKSSRSVCWWLNTDSLNEAEDNSQTAARYCKLNSLNESE